MRLGHFLPFCCAVALCAQFAIAQAHQENPDPVVGLRLQAISYEHGEGVQKDVAKARALYCEASKQGDVEAQFSLGWIYANGRGTPRDEETAAYFFSLAAHQGHRQAKTLLRYVGTPPSEPPECMRQHAPERPQHAFDDVPPERRMVVELLFRLAPDYGVDPYLGLAVMRTESNFNPSAISPKNAQGLMQLIPATAARFKVSKPFDPEQNIRGGLSYLRWLLAYFKGNVPLVVAAYNAGEGTVNRYKGIPPYEETQEYVKRIVRVFKKLEHPFDASVAPPSPELGDMRVRVRM